MLPQNIRNHFIEQYSEKTGDVLKIKETSPLSGGSINDACKIITDKGDFFIKWNNADLFPGMFETETKGLSLLSETNTILIPAVILQQNCGNYNYLVLEYINKGSVNNDFWNVFGKNMAAIHSVKSDYFGLDYDNYIGSLKQFNKKHYNWISFFVEQRLDVQLKLARDNKKITGNDIKSFERLFNRLPEIFPIEQACLIHGDLWSGNYLIAEGNIPCIIDPAVYYGNREMDIAMTKLFGGFNQEFYLSYNNYFALEKGWEKRIDICNLYPLLVHVNLFGGGYLYEVRNIVKHF